MMMVESECHQKGGESDTAKTPIAVHLQRIGKKHPSIVILSMLLISVPMYKFFSFISKQPKGHQEENVESKKSDFPEIAFKLPDRGAATTSDAERLIFGKEIESPEKARDDEFIPLKSDDSAHEERPKQETIKINENRPKINSKRHTEEVKSVALDIPTQKGWRKNNASLYKPANTGEFKKEEKEPTNLSISVGTKIKCRLEIGALSSNRDTLLLRTISSHESIPPGTVLKARSSNDGTRIFVDVFSAVIGGHEKGLRAYAITHNTPGIAAIVRTESLGDRQKSKVGSALLDTAKQVAGTAVGGIAGAAIAGSTSGAASEAQYDMRVDRTRILEVPAGTVFDVVVVE